MAQCRIVSDPQSVWEKLAEGNPVASGCVTLSNNCGHLRTFFYKIKVVPFEKLILKSVNKVKIGQFLTKL